MYLNDLGETEWGAMLLAACERGESAMRRAARSVVADFGDERADAVACDIATTVEATAEPSRPLGMLARAVTELAGPQTFAFLGAALRAQPSEEWAEWAFDILERRGGPETSVQLYLCARFAEQVDVLQRAARSLRGRPEVMREVLSAATADVPAGDLDTFFAAALEQSMIAGTRFGGSDLVAASSMPAARSALSRVVWARYHGRSVLQTFAFAPDEQAFITSDFDAIELAESDAIGLVHRLELDARDVDAWAEYFADFELVGLFPQFDRITSRPDSFPYEDVDFAAPQELLVAHLMRQGGWILEDDGRTFALLVRGGRLRLGRSPFHNGTRWFDLQRPKIGGGGADEAVLLAEATSAAARVLEAFAPEHL